mmetsp:Transcript_26248/g.47396  ORF Transcript_26248/g.47396 Transcript_26248/m.47396 type:complete len:259 (+) Transcript_26248:356-1132(+)
MAPGSDRDSRGSFRCMEFCGCRRVVPGGSLPIVSLAARVSASRFSGGESLRGALSLLEVLSFSSDRPRCAILFSCIVRSVETRSASRPLNQSIMTSTLSISSGTNKRTSVSTSARYLSRAYSDVSLLNVSESNSELTAAWRPIIWRKIRRFTGRFSAPTLTARWIPSSLYSSSRQARIVFPMAPFIHLTSSSSTFNSSSPTSSEPNMGEDFSMALTVGGSVPSANVTPRSPGGAMIFNLISATGIAPTRASARVTHES